MLTVKIEHYVPIVVLVDFLAHFLGYIEAHSLLTTYKGLIDAIILLVCLLIVAS